MAPVSRIAAIPIPIKDIIISRMDYAFDMSNSWNTSLKFNANTFHNFVIASCLKGFAICGVNNSMYDFQFEGTDADYTRANGFEYNCQVRGGSNNTFYGLHLEPQTNAGAPWFYIIQSVNIIAYNLESKRGLIQDSFFHQETGTQQ